MHKRIVLLLFGFLLTSCAMPQLQATAPIPAVTSAATVTAVQSASQKEGDIDNNVKPTQPAVETLTAAAEGVVNSNPFEGIDHSNEISLGSFFDGWKAAVDEQGNLLVLANANGQLVPTEQGLGVVKKDGLVWVWSPEAGRFEVPAVLQGVPADKVVVTENGDLVVIGESGSPERMIRNGEVIETKDGLLFDQETKTVSWWNRQKADWVAVEGVSQEDIFVTKDYITITEGNLLEAVSFIDLITGDEYPVAKISVPTSATDRREASINYLQIYGQNYIWIPYQGRWLGLEGSSLEEVNLNTVNNLKKWSNKELNVDEFRFTKWGKPMEFGWDGENSSLGIWGQAVLLGFLETDNGQVLVLGFEDGLGEPYSVYVKAREMVAEFDDLWVRKRPWFEDTVSISNARVRVTSDISSSIYLSMIGKPILFHLNSKPIGYDDWDDLSEELYGTNNHLIDILKGLRKGSVRDMSDDPMINPVFGDPINLDNLAYIGDITVWVDTLSE